MTKHKGFPIYQPMMAYRGDAWEKVFRFVAKHPDTGESYLLDLTGFTVRFQVRATVDSTVVLTAAPCTVSDTGVTVRIPNSVTATYPHGATWRYDLELTDPSGRPKTMFYGPFDVQGDVAR